MKVSKSIKNITTAKPNVVNSKEPYKIMSIEKIQEIINTLEGGFASSRSYRSIIHNSLLPYIGYYSRTRLIVY